MVMKLEFVWAMASILIYCAIIFYNHRVIRHFQENEKVASARIFLEGRTASGFKVFMLGMIIWGVSMVIGVAALIETDQVYRYGTKIGSFALFVSWLYFMRILANATGIPKSDD